MISNGNEMIEVGETRSGARMYIWFNYFSFKFGGARICGAGCCPDPGTVMDPEPGPVTWAAAPDSLLR